jgi:hypothetical protein
VHGVAGYRYFARAKTGMTWAVSHTQVTVIPDPFGMTEKRDPGSEAGMTLFLRIPIRHQVGRIPQKCLQLSPLSPPEGGGAVKLTEKRDPSRHPCRGVAILDESPFVIPDADPESIQTGFLLIFYAFHGQRRAGISRDVQGTAGYRYFVGAKTGMTWAVSHTQVTVIPVSEQSGEYRNLAFTLFTGNEEPDSLGMCRAQRDTGILLVQKPA